MCEIKLLDKKYLNVIFFLLIGYTFFCALLFFISDNDVGNNIFRFLTSAGKFDDYLNLYRFAKSLPDGNSSIQYSSFLIHTGRLFINNQAYGLITLIIFSVTPAVITFILIYKNTRLFTALLLVIFISLSYPIIFSIFRGNPALPGVLWTISGLLAYMSLRKELAFYCLLIGTLFQPFPAIFLLIFINDGLTYFLRKLGVLLTVQIILYLTLDWDIISTFSSLSGSLEMYKQDYIIGSGGDLYNNSLFFIYKIIFINELDIEYSLYINLIISIIICYKLFQNYISKGKYNTMLYFIFFLLPIYLVLSTPVSADYRLSYLLIPIIFICIYSRQMLKELFIFLLAILPKHFIFFSSAWQLSHPTSLLVYGDLIDTPGITINSIINPLLLLGLLLWLKGIRLDAVK